MSLKKVKVIIAIILLSLSSVTVAGTVVKDISNTGAVQQDIISFNPLNGSFVFFAGFTRNHSYEGYGWSLLSGNSTPFVSNYPNYFGERSIGLRQGTALFTDRNIVRGDRSVSFQFAVNAESGVGTFAITDGSGRDVASITIDNLSVSISTAGGNSSSASGNATSQFSGGEWVLVSGTMFDDLNRNGSDWRLEVFVDNTSSVFANISAPLGYSYGGIEILASTGTVYFTNILFTSDRVAQFIPGYNNMEGYGQGSGEIVTLLQPFTILHANFLLENWSVSRYSTLSFQINAMNITGTERPTASGFFQLGIDLNPFGTIAPWYVPGKNAIAIYFDNHPNPDYMPGFSTPNDTILGLTIQYNPIQERIFFQIVDYSVHNQYRFWNTSISYDGPEFTAAYTQIETSYMNGNQLNGYRFNGTMYNISYGSNISNLMALNSSYMLPFSIDAPSTWSLTYYNNSESGYRQVD